MLPNITYRSDGHIPDDLLAAHRTMSERELALMRLVSLHYQPALKRACEQLKPSTPPGDDMRTWCMNQMARSSSVSWNHSQVVVVGFGGFFRSLQVISPGITLESIATYLLLDGMLWSTFADTRTTLDILYTPASDPGPPYDDDTDYSIVVVLQDMRGRLRASRYYQK